MHTANFRDDYRLHIHVNTSARARRLDYPIGMFDLKKIKLLVCDVDGTLTDGMFIISDTGSTSKSFYTKDFFALQQLQEAGVNIFLLTGSTDSVIEQKFKGLPDCCKLRMQYAKGIDDKVAFLEEHFRNTGLFWEEIAYIGDAGNDLEAMKLSAITACPSDAMSIIKDEANIVCSLPGGKGAVCEFAMYLLDGIKG